MRQSCGANLLNAVADYSITRSLIPGFPVGCHAAQRSLKTEFP
jgi:hypothetical protein